MTSTEEGNTNQIIKKQTRKKTSHCTTSCTYCRSKKIKCDSNVPCSNCRRNSTVCERAQKDGRSKRYKSSYVKTLESQIKSLEDMIHELRGDKSFAGGDISHKQRGDNSWNHSESSSSLTIKTESEYPNDRTESGDKLPNNNKLNGVNDGYNYLTASSHASKKFSPVAIEESNINGGISVYGPTSVYDNIIDPTRKDKLVPTFNMPLLNSPFILQCLSNFFKWQYPDMNCFIYRESFLKDFFHPTLNSVYCSDDLIFAIAALGARISDDEEVYKKADEFYHIAKEKLLSEKLEYPCITSVQALLFLAVYDISNGYTSSGWLLSGLAFRMGYDLGFHLDPKNWLLNDGTSISAQDIAIRSRIYWGCYLCDHFISLVLGRPITLKLSDTTVATSGMLPDLSNIDDYRYLETLESPNITIAVSAKWLADLSKIAEGILTDVFSNSRDVWNGASREKALAYYNIKLMKWRENLPKELQWTKNDLKTRGENPTFTSLKYYYYIILLCLNRPFIITDIATTKDCKEIVPALICEESIGDLFTAVSAFHSVHSLRKASLFMVYSVILSISCILIKNHQSPPVNPKEQNQLEFFLKVLKNCSKSWKLAEKSFNLVISKIRKVWRDSRDEDKFQNFFKELDKIESQDAAKADNDKGSSSRKEAYASVINRFNSQRAASNLISDQFAHPIHNSLNKDGNNNVAEINQFTQESNRPSYWTHNSAVTDNNNNNGKDISNNKQKSNSGIDQNIESDHNISGAYGNASTSSNADNNNNNNNNNTNNNLLHSKMNQNFIGGPPVLMNYDYPVDLWKDFLPDLFNL